MTLHDMTLDDMALSQKKNLRFLALPSRGTNGQFESRKINCEVNLFIAENDWHIFDK